MHRPQHVLVIDIGKTHAKAIVFDRDDAIVSERRARLAAGADGPFEHLPAAAMLEFTEQAVAEAARRFGDISVIPVTHGAAIALVGADGLVLPILDYESARPQDARDYAPPDFAETFSPALPRGLNLGRQLHWLERSFPDAFASAEHLLTLPQYIGWHLSGIAASEVTSLGCHTDLWDPMHGGFSSLARARGWERRFPPLRPAGAALAAVSRVTILNGLHDTNASLVPHLGAAEPVTILSTGTWHIAMSLGGAAFDRLDPARDCLANVDVRGRAIGCARFMGGREYDRLAGGAPPATLADLALLEPLVAAGAFILPNQTECGGPFPNATGALPEAWPTLNGRAALATLYLALMDAVCIELAGGEGPIVVEGPAAGNPLFCGLLGALLPDRPVACADDADATARGAALLALGCPGSGAASRPVPALRLAGLTAYAREWRRRAEALAGLSG